jgi:hypothetical protein
MIDIRSPDHPGRRMSMPDDFVFLTRFNLSINAICATLGATIHARSIWDDLDGIAEPNFSQRYLRRAIDIVGVERILFSTDYPFQLAPHGGGRRSLEEADLSDADREMIASGNWDRLCGDIRRRAKWAATTPQATTSQNSRISC